MSWLGKAALYALKEAARPALEEMGKKVGSSAGDRIARRIDVSKPSASAIEVSEDERTL